MLQNHSDYNYCECVRISTSAYRACLSHSLITDTEEIMGLLLGSVQKIQGKTIIEIYSTVSLSRNCKEKDRVEFDEIQIANASEYSEKLGKKNRLEVRVVGWYHSHPKITVPPSHVDLNTQFSQQYQGEFVGLIFSVFNSNQQTNVNSIQVIAFQSKINNSGVTIPIYIPILVQNEVSFYSSKKISNIHELSLFQSSEVFSNLLSNLLIEEEEESNKQKQFIKEEHYINKDSHKLCSYNDVILSANRQALLVKIIELVALPLTIGLVNEKQCLIKLIQFYDRLNASLEKKLEYINTNKESNSNGNTLNTNNTDNTVVNQVK